jgi:ribose-phosphate pyrophosphokinase
MSNRDLDNILVFAGKGDEDYVSDICTLLGIPLGYTDSRYHEDSDPYFRVDPKVGGRDVYFVSRFHKNTLHNWIEMLSFANAALNEGARSVNVFETYLGCSRQERKSKPGEAVTLQAKAQSIMGAGVSTFNTFAAHADATILAFNPAVTRFTSFPLWPAMIRVIYNVAGPDAMVKLVGPDAGAAKSVRDILSSTTVEQDDRFDPDLAIVDKDRVHADDDTKSGALVGEVESKLASIFDDESVSGGSICDASAICLANGASGAYVALAHPKFAMIDRGLERLAAALKEGTIEKLITTNSCFIPDDFYDRLGVTPDSGRVIVIPTQPLVAEHILRSSQSKGAPYLFSSRGVLRPYLRVRDRVEDVETSERDGTYEDRFRSELELYRKLAAPVLGPYSAAVGKHRELT